MYKPLPEHVSFPAIEEEILTFWDEHRTFERSLSERPDAPNFTFYEGPPTVNGKPGLHHLMGRTLKDLVCRYKTMQGFRVERRAGWDTHGLPVEIAVEKQLGLTMKNQIEEFGVETFNATCKKLVYSNIENDEGWGSFTRRMGYWVDLKNPYITCTNNYIESVWWAIQQFFNKGLIKKGFKVVPQSPTIETPLSSHELSLGYKDVRDPNCYCKLKILSSPVAEVVNAEIVVWTTTPWTLISNVALAVGQEIDYVLVKNIRTVKQGNEKVTEEFLLVLAEARLTALDGESTVLGRWKGKELIGTHYEQIFTYVSIDRNVYPNALTVLPGEFVSTEDGSGVVHLAPAFGADDYEMSKKHHLPMVQPVTPGGRFIDGIGEFSNRPVKTFTYSDRIEEGVDKDVIIALKVAGKIYRSSNDYLHSYPHCWRTGNPVIYYARDSWFISSPEYKGDMIALNKTINWQPKEIGTGRFGNWLEDVKDWSLSRDRYWGTPLPIWVSEDGTDMFAVGSIQELSEGLWQQHDGRLVPLSESGHEIDLHRPFVDNIVFVKNEKVYRRVHEVIDVWFDSGAMPFAQFHYPFENKEQFEKSFPADFIAEGIDQTRGWFYTLHNIATGLFGKPAFKNIVVNELILDKDGQKMSKSKGNTVDPFEIMGSFGADAVRWYFTVNNPPWRPTLFNAEDIRNTVLADFFRSLTNMYSFFALYANIDGFTGAEDETPIESRPEIDRWILSKLQSVMKEYIREMEAYDVFKANRVVQEFTINDVSNWYVRRNRRRFWKGERDAEKIAAYQTLRTVLIGISAMMAPTSPFLSEYLYRRLRAEGEPESIHLLTYSAILRDNNEHDLERRMSLAQGIVFLVRSLRERAKIKTRQPLAKILIPVSSPAMRRDIQAVEDIIKDEVNVKAIEFVSDDSNIVQKHAKPNFKTIGKKFGKQTQAAANAIKALTSEEVRRLEHEGSIVVQLSDNSSLTIDRDDAEIAAADIEGWLVASDSHCTVALDTEITPVLRHEGIAREFVNRIQNLRKDSGFEVTDRITLRIFTENSDWKVAISEMRSYIAQETLAVAIDIVSEQEQTLALLDIDEASIWVHIATSVE